MPQIPDVAAVRQKLAMLPVEAYPAGATVLAAGATSGNLLVLKEGAVEVVKDGVRIAKVADPGAVLGELALLLDQPHTADVRALAPSTFHVADGKSALLEEPALALYVAVVMAQRVDGANRALLEVRSRSGSHQPGSAVGRLLGAIARALRFDSGDGPFPWYSMIPERLLAAVSALPLASYAAGDLVLAAGSTTGRLLILEDGAVEVLSDGMSIGRIGGRGAVLGELAVFLDRPHTADVRAIEASTFRIADPTAFLHNPAAAHYVALVMAKRVDAANRALVEASRRLHADQPGGPTARMLDRIAGSLHHGRPEGGDLLLDR